MVNFVTLVFFRMKARELPGVILIKPNREANTKSYNQTE